MIAAAFDEAGRRDPHHVRQRVFLVDGTSSRSPPSRPRRRKELKVPVLIDYIHVSGYIGKASACLHPDKTSPPGSGPTGSSSRPARPGESRRRHPRLRRQQNPRKPRKRGLDLIDLDKAVTYLENNQRHMKYDKALANGWPIATGMIEGSCRYVIEDRFGITGARWSPEGAETILRLRAVVVNDDLDDYMTYYKSRYRREHHLTRYDQDTIEALSLDAA